MLAARAVTIAEPPPTATTDYAYIRNTRREAVLQSASGRAPVFA